MIGILNYGLGNVSAFENLFRRAHIAAKQVSKPADLKSVTALLLPGVGAFDYAMQRFDDSGLRVPTEELVLGDARLPILGVCVGMQMMANRSEEGESDGLGWIPATVRKLSSATRLPHLGWNHVAPTHVNGLFAGLTEPRFYFLHSYYFHCEDPRSVAATTKYGHSFCCAVSRGNISGVQFHPEKSHRFGSQLLLNFASGATC